MFLILLGSGFVVGETLTGLKRDIASNENYDEDALLEKVSKLIDDLESDEGTNDSELQAEITELETALNALKSQDNSQLQAKITELETALNALESQDNSELQAKITELTNRINALENSSTSNFTIMVDGSGNYLRFEEVARLLVNVSTNDLGCFDQGDIWMSSLSSGLSNEEILVRMTLMFKELSNYNQYFMNSANINLGIVTILGIQTIH
ncbi:hypothetical protein KHQ81_07465 [Mycoplasmatota bacterium]|nr:hypothetical protein KHQ81_07465 [Mycoplasmatota bacterium]